MKIIFHNSLNSNDIPFLITRFDLELGEILHEIQEKYPELSQKNLKLVLKKQPLELSWTIQYLLQHFQLNEFDTLEIQEDFFIPLKEIQEIENLLYAKDDHLYSALKHLPEDLILQAFGLFTPTLQQKLLKNLTPLLKENLSRTFAPSPSLEELAPLFLQKLREEGEKIFVKEQQNRSTQRMKKILKRQQAFLSEPPPLATPPSSVSSPEPVSHFIRSLSQQALAEEEKQKKELSSVKGLNQQKLLNALLEEKTSPPFSNSTTLEDILNKENKPQITPDSSSWEKHFLENPPRPPEELAQILHSTSEPPSQAPPETLEALPLVIASPVVVRLPQTGKIDALYQETEAGFSPLPVLPLPLETPLEPETLLTSDRDSILSKRQLITAGRALYRPPPQKEKTTSLTEDNSQTDPLPSEPQALLTPFKYQMQLDLDLPTRLFCFQPDFFKINLLAQPEKDTSFPHALLGQIHLECPSLYMTFFPFSIHEGRNTFQVEVLAITSGLFQGRGKIYFLNELLGEFPFEIEVSKSKLSRWILISSVFSLIAFAQILPWMIFLPLLALLFLLFFLLEQPRFSPRRHLHFEFYVKI
jgi:hypothetical protein